jgi:glycosyltransferase involved in cell wall biosynthesis
MELMNELLTRRRIARHGGELQPRQVHAEAIAKAWCIVVVCVRNERPRLTRFLGHYRHLGAAHFLFVDNASTDDTEAYLREQPDCSVWRAEGSYKASNFGMDWCNHLLSRHGVGKWCVTVDPDEFLLFPHCERRGLRSLTRYMDGIGQPSLFAPLIDVYGSGPLSQARLTADTDPFELCPYFDRFNLTQQWNEGTGSFWVQGGVRMRRFFADNPAKAPALNKVPLIKWRAGLRYVSSMHHTSRRELNCTVRGNPLAVSGVLFHFKYVNLLTAKAQEEMKRGEHYDGSAEYKAYLDAGDPVLHDPEVSVRFGGTRQLQELGFMQAGGWF